MHLYSQILGLPVSMLHPHSKDWRNQYSPTCPVFRIFHKILEASNCLSSYYEACNATKSKGASGATKNLIKFFNCSNLVASPLFKHSLYMMSFEVTTLIASKLFYILPEKLFIIFIFKKIFFYLPIQKCIVFLASHQSCIGAEINCMSSHSFIQRKTSPYLASYP